MADQNSCSVYTFTISMLCYQFCVVFWIEYIEYIIGSICSKAMRREYKVTHKTHSSMLARNIVLDFVDILCTWQCAAPSSHAWATFIFSVIAILQGLKNMQVCLYETLRISESYWVPYNPNLLVWTQCSSTSNRGQHRLSEGMSLKREILLPRQNIQAFLSNLS